MKNTKEMFMIGMELSRDFTQVSYLLGNQEVQSMSTISDEQKFNIPTCLLKFYHKLQWCVGEEAIVRNEEHQGALVTDLLDRVIEKRSLSLDENEYAGSELLDLFIREIMKMIHLNVSKNQITHAVISVPELSEALTDCLRDILKRLGIPEENIRIISHTESFIYYVTYQSREIWTNEVLLFDFNRFGMDVKRMQVVTNRNPAVIRVAEESAADDLSMDMLVDEQGQKEADIRFAKVAKKALSGHVVSAVFLIGEGFKKPWAKNSLSVLCGNRRVFQGDNLIAKGAGYCAREMVYNDHLTNYIFQCKGRTKADVSLMVLHDGREIAKPLTYAGSNWTDARTSVEGILDHADSLRFIVTSPISGRSKVLRMDLKGLPKRPNKTTRVRVSLRFKNESSCEVLVTDMGFGDFFPSSGLVFKETVDLEEF